MIFRGKFGFMSNFFTSPFIVESKRLNKKIKFNCVEVAFQASKATNLKDLMRFKGLKPKEARKLGREIVLRPNWERIKFKIMEKLVTEKFLQNPNLLERLCKVEGLIIEEGPWTDGFWSINMGKILMKIRDSRHHFL